MKGVEVWGIWLGRRWGVRRLYGGCGSVRDMAGTWVLGWLEMSVCEGCGCVRDMAGTQVVRLVERKV